MPGYLLFHSPGSAASRAVRFHLDLLRDRGADVAQIEIYPVDLSKKENRRPDFLEINPLGTVPAMQTPWGVLTESRAIMWMLAELVASGAAPWGADTSGWTGLPQTVWQRARCISLLDWDQGTFYKAIADVVYPQLFAKAEPSHEALAALTKAFEHLDHMLRDDSDFLLGPTVSIADISIAMGATMCELVNCEVDDVPHVWAWMDRMRALGPWASVNEPFEQWKSSVASSKDAAHKNARRGKRR